MSASRSVANARSLANFAMRQDRIFEVEPQIGKIRASAVAHGEIRLARKDGNDIRRKGTHLQIGRALAKFEGTDDAVGHDSESHSIIAIRGASWKYSGLRSRTTSSSCDCCRKRKGPEPMG